MKLADFSVNRPVAISMLIVAMVILGLVSVPKLAIDLYPDMDFPVLVIATSYNEADPAEVEKVITKPLEESVGTVSNIDKMSSQSMTGTSLVIVKFNWGTDVDKAATDVREKLDMFRDYLPDDAGSPRIIKMDPNSAPIMLYTLSGNVNLTKLDDLAENKIKNRIERVGGVGSVSVAGGRQREFKVIIDQAKLESYNLTATQVEQAIRSENISGTSGLASHGKEDMSIRVLGEYSNVNDLTQIQVPIGNGSYIKLSDLATVEDSYKKISQYSFVNGKPAVSIDVFKASGGNTVQVAEAVKNEVTKINQLLPDGVKLTNILDSSKYIQDSINNVIQHTLIGGVLAMIILYLFLRNVRSTMVVAIVMPIAVIVTFTMMYFSKQSINILSLGGLALGLGSLVDFSVVVLESIYRYRQNGYGIVEAAKAGADEVGNAVLASGMSQVVVFAPIIFVEGLAGILFGPMALTVSISHVAALFAALTLVPMMSSKLLKNVPPTNMEFPPGKTKNPLIIFGKGFNKLSIWYGKTLHWALGHRKRVVIVTVLILAGSLSLTPLLGTEFIPTMDQGEMAVTVKMPPGTTVEQTKLMSDKVTAVTKKELPDYERIFSQIGTGDMAWLGLVGGNEATIKIKLPSLEKRNYSTDQAMEKIRKATQNIAGAEITVVDSNGQSFGSGQAVEVSVRGDDIEVLKQLGDLMLDSIKEVPGTRNVTNSLDKAKTEVQIKVDRQRASIYGLSTAQVMEAVHTAFDGQLVGKVRTGEDEVDIRLKYDEDFQNNFNQLNNLIISSPTGAKVMLASVAKVTLAQSPDIINRTDQTREVKITADVSGRDVGSVNKDVENKLDKMALPDGYSFKFGGQAQDMSKSFADLGLAMILSIILVYMVMAAQFESLFQPFIIMFSLPTTLVGVVLGLLVTGNKISVPALIGGIMLIGIVVNNAIVLIDYVNTLRQRGIARNEAILSAGPVRLRPILMTTLTTVLALLPMAFGGGDGSEGMAPLAIVVSFGLTLSTLITLILVPVVYTIFDDLGDKIKKQLKRIKTPKINKEDLKTMG